MVFTKKYRSNNNTNEMNNNKGDNLDDKEALVLYPETLHNMSQALATIRDMYGKYNNDHSRSDFFIDYNLIC